MAVPARRAPTTTTRLNNATSRSTNVFRDIERILVAHKARELHYEYAGDNSGHVVALVFALDVEGRRLSFRMPARVEQVELAMFGTNRNLTDAKHKQAYQTAFANIRDWLKVQMAMIDIRLAKAEEIFLPYLLNSEGQTFFEAIQARQFLLEAPSQDRGE